MRRFGAPPKPGRRYRTRPGAYVILADKRGVLLTHQARPVPEFQLPGGGIDPGEHTVPALHREVMEETGWTMSPPTRLGVWRRFTYMPEYDLWADKICTIYRARPVLCKGDPIEDGHTAVWADPRDAIALVSAPGDRAFLQRFFP